MTIKNDDEALKSQHKIWKNNISKISILTAVVISSFFRSLTPNYFFFIKSIDQSKLFNSCFPLRSQRGKNPTFPSLCFHRFEHLFGFNLYFQDMCVGPSWGNQNAQRKRIYCQISDDKVTNL